MPALPPMSCDGQPLSTTPTAAALAQNALHGADKAKFQRYSQQLEHLLTNTNPELLTGEGARLVCATNEEADYMRLLLDRRGLTHIELRVKPKLPARKLAKNHRKARQRAGYKARR